MILRKGDILLGHKLGGWSCPYPSELTNNTSKCRDRVAGLWMLHFHLTVPFLKTPPTCHSPSASLTDEISSLLFPLQTQSSLLNLLYIFSFFIASLSILFELGGEGIENVHGVRRKKRMNKGSEHVETLAPSFLETIWRFVLPQSQMWTQKRTVEGVTFVSGICFLSPVLSLRTYDPSNSHAFL